MLAHEAFDPSVLCAVGYDAQEHLVASEIPLDGIQGVELLATDAAPGRPEMDEQGFAAVVGERYSLALEIHELEFWDRLTSGQEPARLPQTQAEEQHREHEKFEPDPPQPTEPTPGFGLCGRVRGVAHAWGSLVGLGAEAGALGSLTATA